MYFLIPVLAACVLGVFVTRKTLQLFMFWWELKFF